MEPEISLPQSQVPTTCSCPEPAQYSPYPTSRFLKIHLILSSNLCLSLPSGSSSPRFPHHNYVYASLLSHTRYMPRPSNSSRFYHSKNIFAVVQIIKLLISLHTAYKIYLVNYIQSLSHRLKLYCYSFDSHLEFLL